MKHLVFILSFVLSSTTLLAQTNRLFEKFTFDSTYKIVGICSQLDEKQEYRKWTFIINNPEKLNLAKTTVTHGEELTHQTHDDHDLEICIIKDKEVIETYYVSPRYKYVNYYPTDSTPGMFQFDVSQIHQIADIAPISHRFQDFSFKSVQEFNKFLLANKSKKNFLCYEDVSEELNGRFTVIIPKSNRIQKFKDGWELIESELKRITQSKKDYLMSFNLTLSTDSAFYYQVNTSKAIHQKFALKDYSKSAWVANLIEISTVWLK